MFGWPALSAAIVLIAALLGFVLLTGLLAFVAQLFFLLVLGLSVIGIVARWMRRDAEQDRQEIET